MGVSYLGSPLAETQKLLYIANRSGNRPSHEDSAMYFNSAIELCKEAGFRKIGLRGDTDFSSTTHLDRWDRDGVKFVLGYDANKTLAGIADLLPESAWKTLSRQKPTAEKQRAKRPNFKERIVGLGSYRDAAALLTVIQTKLRVWMLLVPSLAA